MKNINFAVFTSSLIILFANFSFGQGCSDADFCTINSLKPNSEEGMEAIKNQFKIGGFFGKADNSISVYGNYFEYNRQLNEKFGVDLKLTTIAQNGNGISVFGISDVFFNTSFRATEKLRLTIGAKIPLSNASKLQNNIPLPMDYQASLGTLDLIFGIGYAIKKIQLVAAIQQPLTQNNNQFFSNIHPENSNLRIFQTTNKYHRGGDVLLRISYPISLNKRIKLTPSLLPIYHLSNDKYTDEFNLVREII